MSGSALYFSLPVAPGLPVYGGLVAAGLAAGLWHCCRPGRAAGGLLVLLAAGVLFGLVRSEFRTSHAGEIPAIDTGGRAIHVTGWLGAVEASASGRSRLVVRIPETAERRAYRIRVLGEAGNVRPGDAVSVRAVLSPPRAAAVPGGYDFAFHAYFAGIAATGYAVEPARAGPGLEADAASRALARLRWAMAERIRARLDERTGALAAALLAGDRSGLPPQDVEALRTAGLGHVLAISGMHMALLSGGIFFAIRAMFAAWPRWAARHDAAVPAAIGGLVAAAIYLALSGAAIPTQRAFIMTASVLGAVLVRRRALSFHTLAVALVAVLTMTPEAVVTPGFQMSFAAVAALIAAAQVWQARRPPPAPLDAGRGLRTFFGGLGTTSFVAGLATSGFAAFHFHRLAAFGLAGNLLVMPVFSLLVMPAGVLAIVLMPVGLDGPALDVMSWGLSAVLALAHWVAGWPGAERTVVSAPGWILALYAAGFAAVTAGRGRLRLGGLGLVVLALAGWAGTERPDLFVTRDGVVLARTVDDTGWGVSDTRRSRFPARVFLEGEGETGRPQALVQTCDDVGCGRPGAGSPANYVRLTSFDQLAEDCRRARLIVTERTVPDHRIRRCEAVVIDGTRLARRGGVLVWMEETGAMRLRHVLPARTRRWHAREH
ncbi:ComEC/Rec2 family competence protein [Maricaulis sp.]|uniref:ComEC/Rec2 family competence protein n=1 Tax=Maricaulis sp. TaxID=1486257 RepID=UPI00262F7EEA|nr:ComEC/Rec2 family competence protein [Maricaulis sp.]